MGVSLPGRAAGQLRRVFTEIAGFQIRSPATKDFSFSVYDEMPDLEILLPPPGA